jgi:RHS repeat-associated protein
MLLGDGAKVIFTRPDTQSPWRSDTGKDLLLETPNGPVFVRASDETRWQFNALGGLLQTITQRNGWAMTLSYSGNTLTRVTNAFGRSLLLTYDTQGRLTAITPPGAAPITYSYDANARLTSVRYADGTSRSYLYERTDLPNALTGIVNEAGQRYASFDYDSAGRATYTGHAGGADAYAVNYPAGSSSQGRMVEGDIDPSLYRDKVSLTTPLGYVQTYNYQGGDGTLRLVSSDGPLKPDDLPTRILGDGNMPVSETDYVGNVTTFTWDTSRRLLVGSTQAANKPEAQTTSTQWHPAFRLPVLVTEAGRSTALTYDTVGNKLGETITDTATNERRTRQWTYAANGLPATMTDERGGVWQYGYDAQGNRTSATNPLNQQTRTAYDTAGRIAAETAPNGLVTSYTYDARGRVLAQTSGGETTAYSYNATGQIAGVTQPNGYAVSYSYDTAQRLAGAADNRGNQIQYTLDAQGNRTREEVRDASGAIARVTSRVINNLNRLTAIQGSTGQTTQLAYDANGEATAQTDPLNQTTRQTLDGLRRPTATTFADNASASQSYNQLDQLTAVTDPKGVQTSYTTNAFGDVMSETSPDIGTVNYERDALGNVTKKTDAKGNITTITRDALGRPTTIQYATDHIVNYTYDSNTRTSGNQTGYLSKIEDKSGTTTYERDVLGRITTKTQTVNDNPASPSRYKTSYAYAAGELASITYPSGLKVIYRRSATGQITGIDTVVNSFLKILRPAQPFVSNLTYTALQQPRSWSWANGDSASRSFDTDGRMTQNEFASYTYDAASRITGITQSLWASGTTTGGVTLYTTPLTWTASYDSRNRLTSFARAGASTSYTYDANSNRLTSEDTRTSDTDLDLDFSKPDMSQATSQALSVDPASNRLFGFSQRITTSQAGMADAVTKTTVTYSIDANGAMTSDGLRTFEYDAADRMSKVRLMKAGEAASVMYLHNALGQRVFKSEVTADQKLPKAKTLGAGFVAWLKTNFQWMYAQALADASVGTAYTYADGQLPEWALLGEYDNGSAKGTGRTEYIWLPTRDGAMPIGLYRGGKFYAIHSDHLGTPRVMTSDTNTPVWQWPYSGFGSNKPTGVLKATANPQQVAMSQPKLLRATSPAELNLRWPGQYDDAETGLFQNWNREYNARTGRYDQFDPLGLGGGINGYAYVGNSPLTSIDPTGLVKWAGSSYNFSVVDLIGASFTELDLWSECGADGKRWHIIVKAVGPSVGIGVKVASTVSDVSFDDGEASANPNAFNGWYKGVGAGITFGAIPFKGAASVGFGKPGIGVSQGIGRFGGVTSDASATPSTLVGRDFSASGTIGSSTVTFAESKPCVCKN